MTSSQVKVTPDLLWFNKMDELQLNTLITEIERIEKDSATLNSFDAQRRVISVLTTLLETDGYSLKLAGGFHDLSVDLLGERTIRTDHLFKVGIQYKHRLTSNIGIHDIASQIVSAHVNGIDRLLFITSRRFTPGLLARVLEINRNFPTEIELLDLASLKTWAARLGRKLRRTYSGILAAVVDVSKQFARLVANDPTGLDDLEWRDMERMLAAVFERLGFKVILTPGSKDRGKDLVLLCSVQGMHQSYAVEVKHWRSRKHVGKGYLSDFVKVVAKERHDGGLYLATFGFTDDAIEALTEVQRETIKLGVDRKVIALCQTFVKAESGIWSPPSTLPELLFDDGPQQK